MHVKLVVETNSNWMIFCLHVQETSTDLLLSNSSNGRTTRSVECT